MRREREHEARTATPRRHAARHREHPRRNYRKLGYASTARTGSAPSRPPDVLSQVHATYQVRLDAPLCIDAICLRRVGWRMADGRAWIFVEALGQRRITCRDASQQRLGDVNAAAVWLSPSPRPLFDLRPYSLELQMRPQPSEAFLE